MTLGGGFVLAYLIGKWLYTHMTTNLPDAIEVPTPIVPGTLTLVSDAVALNLIDVGISDLSGRSLVSTDEMTDLLLDIRRALSDVPTL